MNSLISRYTEMIWKACKYKFSKILTDFFGLYVAFLNEGAIVNTRLIQVPIQWKTADEIDAIKDDKIPEDWEDNQRKYAPKDTDARWTVKHNKSYYMYKNHILIDGESKIIRDYQVTSASVHDSRVFEELIEEVKPNEAVFADSAYSSEELKVLTKEKSAEPFFV